MNNASNIVLWSTSCVFFWLTGTTRIAKKNRKPGKMYLTRGLPMPRWRRAIRFLQDMRQNSRCFVLVLLFKNLDYIYYEILDPIFNPGVTDIEANTLSRWGYFFLNILIFVLFALVFYRLTAKAIKQESERHLQEQNLLYAAIAHDLKCL